MCNCVLMCSCGLPVQCCSGVHTYENGRFVSTPRLRELTREEREREERIRYEQRGNKSGH